MTRKAVKNAPLMTFCQSDKLSNLSQQHRFPSSPKYNGDQPADKYPISPISDAAFFLEFVAKLAGAKALAKPISKLSPRSEIRDFKTRSVAERLKKSNTLDCGTSLASTD